MSDLQHDQIPEQALAWHRAGLKVALATVIETWGSAPRPVGSMLAISDQAEMAGSVSGGCVEGAVVAEALEALEDGVPRMLDYGVSDDEAFAVGLACGGRIRVMVEPLGVGQGPWVETIEALVADRAARVPVIYAVNPQTWDRRLITDAPDPLAEAAQARFHSDKSGFDGDWFLGVHNPPLRLAVAARSKSSLAASAGMCWSRAILPMPASAIFLVMARFPPGLRFVRDSTDRARGRRLRPPG